VRLYRLVRIAIKIMLAYSSVVHINFTIASLFSLSKADVDIAMLSAQVAAESRATGRSNSGPSTLS